MIGFAKATVENLKDVHKWQNIIFFFQKQADSIKTIHKFCKDHLHGYEIFNETAKAYLKNKLKLNQIIKNSILIMMELIVAVVGQEHDLKFGAIMNLIGFSNIL